MHVTESKISFYDFILIKFTLKFYYKKSFFYTLSDAKTRWTAGRKCFRSLNNKDLTEKNLLNSGVGCFSNLPPACHVIGRTGANKRFLFMKLDFNETSKITSHQHRKAVKLFLNKSLGASGSAGGTRRTQWTQHQRWVQLVAVYAFIRPLCSSVWFWLRGRQSRVATSACCSIFCCNPFKWEPPCSGPRGPKLEYSAMKGEG